MKTKQEVIELMQMEISRIIDRRDKFNAGEASQRDKTVFWSNCNSSILAYQHCLELVEQLPD